MDVSLARFLPDLRCARESDGRRSTFRYPFASRRAAVCAWGASANTRRACSRAESSSWMTSFRLLLYEGNLCRNILYKHKLKYARVWVPFPLAPFWRNFEFRLRAIIIIFKLQLRRFWRSRPLISEHIVCANQHKQSRTEHMSTYRIMSSGPPSKQTVQPLNFPQFPLPISLTEQPIVPFRWPRLFEREGEQPLLHLLNESR